MLMSELNAETRSNVRKPCLQGGVEYLEYLYPRRQTRLGVLRR